MPATGENRAVVVNVGAFDSAANSIASVTYGGVAMTKVGATQGVMTDNGVVEQYILVDPPTGANDVVITMSGSAADELFGSASGWVDVDQSTPAINSNNGSTDGVTNPSLSVTVDGLDVGIGFLLFFSNSSTTSTESDTLLHEREAVGSSSGYSAQYGDGTFGWTLSVTSDNDYIGFSLVDAALVFGDDTQGSGAFPASGDRAFVTKLTMPENGNMIRGYAHFDSSATAGCSAKLIVLTNSSDTPGTLVAASAGAAVPAGGGLVDLGAISGSLVASTEYFIGVVWSDFQASVSEDESLSSQVTRMANGTFSYSSPPASWPGTDASYDTVRVNAFVTYELDAGIPDPLIYCGTGNNAERLLGVRF